jgi:hypothetical protein
MNSVLRNLKEPSVTRWVQKTSRWISAVLKKHRKTAVGFKIEFFLFVRVFSDDTFFSTYSACKHEYFVEDTPRRRTTEYNELKQESFTKKAGERRTKEVISRSSPDESSIWFSVLRGTNNISRLTPTITPGPPSEWVGYQP